MKALFISATWDEPFWAVFATYAWKQKNLMVSSAKKIASIN